MKRFGSMVWLVAGTLAVSVPGIWRAPASEPQHQGQKLLLKDVSFLEGHWRSGEGAEQTDENWLPGRGGSMAGSCHIGNESKRAVYEMMLIEEDDKGLTYRMLHFTANLKAREKEPLVFDVRRGDHVNEIILDRKEGDDTTRIIYGLDGLNSMNVTLEKVRRGKRSVTRFPMKRVEPSVAP